MLVVEDHIGSNTRVAHRDEVQVTPQLASHLVEVRGFGRCCFNAKKEKNTHDVQLVIVDVPVFLLWSMKKR